MQIANKEIDKASFVNNWCNFSLCTLNHVLARTEDPKSKSMEYILGYLSEWF